MKWKMKLGALAKSAEILIYGDISTYESFWDDSAITPQKFNDELKALGDDVDEITVRINSNGGSVFAGVAIHSMLKRHKAKIIVLVDGIAASIASVIAMAGDEIVMSRGSMFFLHPPETIGWGNAEQFRKLADDLDAIGMSMMDIYENRTGMDRNDLTALLDAQSFLNTTEAIEKGFADRLDEDSQPIAAFMRDGKAIINGIEMDLSKFKNAPKLPNEKPTDANAEILKEIKSLKNQLAIQSKTPKKIQATEGPAFGVGDRIDVNIDPPHMPGQSGGEVREAVLTWVYGIVFDGMEDMGVHKWYVESELTTEDAAEDDDITDENGNKKKKPMKMQQKELPIVATGRNIDLEIKSLELYS